MQAKQLTAAGSHTCAITNDGNLRCWGANSFGETGDMREFGRGKFGPIGVAKLPGPAIAIASGDSVTCAYLQTTAIVPTLELADDGVVPRPSSHGTSAVYCFGDTSTVPTAATLSGTPEPAGPPRHVTAGQMHYAAGLATALNAPALTAFELDAVGRPCFANGDGLACFADGERTSFAPFDQKTEREACRDIDDGGTECERIEVPAIGITRVARSTSHSCIVTDTGELWCWGDNRVGALGDGATTAAAEPKRIALPGDAVALDVAVGIEYSCVTTRDGVYCAGANSFGQLGADSAELNSTSFAPVAGLPSTPSKLVASNQRTCAISDGDVYCWGADLWTDAQRSAVKIEGLAGPSHDLALGSEHVCATTSKGVQCWGGHNLNGELGHHGATSAVPVFVPAKASINLED